MDEALQEKSAVMGIHYMGKREREERHHEEREREIKCNDVAITIEFDKMRVRSPYKFICNDDFVLFVIQVMSESLRRVVKNISEVGILIRFEVGILIRFAIIMKLKHSSEPQT